MEVKVNVYDIASKVNRYVSWMGLGAYHTGVQIGSREYTFSNGGVIYHTPLDAGEEAVFKETIDMGEVDSMSEVNAAVGQLRTQFAPGSYNLNHFTDALVRKLVGKGIPAYINRAAKLGAGFGPKDVTDSDGKKGKKKQDPQQFKKAGGKASTARPKLSDAQMAKLAKIKGAAAKKPAKAQDELDAEDDDDDKDE